MGGRPVWRSCAGGVGSAPGGGIGQPPRPLGERADRPRRSANRCRARRSTSGANLHSALPGPVVLPGSDRGPRRGLQREVEEKLWEGDWCLRLNLRAGSDTNRPSGTPIVGYRPRPNRANVARDGASSRPLGLDRPMLSVLVGRWLPAIAPPLRRPFNGTHLDPTWDRLDAGCGLSH